MTTHRMRPRIHGERAQGAFARTARPGLGIGLGVVVAGIFVLLALLAGETAIRWAYVSFAAAFALFAWYVRELARAQEPGWVQVGATGPLRFAPSRSLQLLPFGIAVLAVIPGILQLVAATSGAGFGARGGSIWLTLASGAGVLWLGQQLWNLRLPTGLTVTPQGLVGVRGAGHLHASWEDIAEITVTRAGNGAKLHVIASNGSLAQVPAAALGSDPSVVAAIVRHFHTSPGDRQVLDQGVRAIRTVEDYGPNPPATND